VLEKAGLLRPAFFCARFEQARALRPLTRYLWLFPGGSNMLKVKVLAATTAAALFAVGGAIAQTGSASRSAGTDKAPTAPTGPKEAGGSAPSFSAIDKNNDGRISRAEWNEYYRLGAAGGATGSATDKAPTAPSGPKESGGSEKAKPGSAASGATGGSTGAAAGSSATDKAPTAPSGPKESGGTK
jgi:hypothetical protein